MIAVGSPGAITRVLAEKQNLPGDGETRDNPTMKLTPDDKRRVVLPLPIQKGDILLLDGVIWPGDGAGSRCGNWRKAIDGASAGAVSVAARRFSRRLETERPLRALAQDAESYLSNVQS